MNEATPPPPPEPPPAPEAPAAETAEETTEETPSTGEGQGDSSNRTLMLVLAYLGVLALIPLLVEKDDKEVQWHAKHGLVLLGMWIAIGVVFTVLSSIPFFGCLVMMVSLILPLAVLVLHIIAIVKAVKGERLIIPGVSQYADRF